MKLSLKKTMLTAALCAVTLGSVFSFAACGSEPQAEELGTYQAIKVWEPYDAMMQGRPIDECDGWMLDSNSTALTIRSDNTFTCNQRYWATYSSDGGETWAELFNEYWYITGTYEVVSEFEDLNEKTIKIVSLTSVNGAVNSNSEDQAELEEAQKFLAEDPMIGQEVTLNGEYEMDACLFEYHVGYRVEEGTWSFTPGA